MKRVLYILLLFISTISFGQTPIMGGNSGRVNSTLSFSQVGNYLNDNFQRSSLGGSYTTSLPNATLTFPSSTHLHVTGGNSSFNNVVSYTNSGIDFAPDKYKIKLGIVAQSNTSSDAIGIGMPSVISGNPASYYVKIDLGTPSNAALELYNAQSFGSPLLTISGLTFTIGDSLLLEVTRNGPTFLLALTNIKTSQVIQNIYTYDRTLGSNYEPNLAIPTVYFFQGTQDVWLYQIIDKTQLNGNLVISGTSISEGYKSTLTGNDYPSVLFSGNTLLYDVNAGVSERASEGLLRQTIILNAAPKYCLLEYGVNELYTGVSLATFRANVDTLVVRYQRAGVTPILLSLVPQDAHSVLPSDSVLQVIAALRSVVYVDITTPLGISGGITINPLYSNADSVHPNNAGHAVIATVLKNTCPQLFTSYVQQGIEMDRIPIIGTSTTYNIGSDSLGRFFRYPTSINLAGTISPGNPNDVLINRAGYISTPGGDSLAYYGPTGSLIVGAFTSSPIGRIEENDAGGSNTGLWHVSTGSTGVATAGAQNDAGKATWLATIGSGFVTSGINVANTGYLFNTAPNGLDMVANSGPIRYFANGTTEVGRMTNTSWMWGVTSPTRTWTLSDAGGTGSGFRMTSTGNTTSSYTMFEMANQHGDLMEQLLTNSSFTPAAPQLASQFELLNTGAGGLLIWADGSGNIDNVVGATLVGHRIFNNGHNNFGGNTTDNAAWVQLTAGTTSTAQLFYNSSTAPTSPTTGMVWFDGTNLVYKTMNLAPAVTINNDLGTSSLAWRDIYFSHTVGESAIGVSSSLGTNVSSVTPAGNDEDFTITMVTSGAVSGTMAAIAFGRTWGAAPHCVISSADATTGSAVALSVGGYEALNATSASSMTFTAVITASGTYKWNCHCGN